MKQFPSVSQNRDRHYCKPPLLQECPSLSWHAGICCSSHTSLSMRNLLTLAILLAYSPDSNFILIYLWLLLLTCHSLSFSAVMARLFTLQGQNWESSISPWALEGVTDPCAEVSQVRLGRSSNTFQQTVVQFFGRQGCAHHETHSWHLPGWEWRSALAHCPVPFLPPLFRTQFTEVLESTRSVSAYLAVGNGSGLTAFPSTTSPPPNHSTAPLFFLANSFNTVSMLWRLSSDFMVSPQHFSIAMVNIIQTHSFYD